MNEFEEHILTDLTDDERHRSLAAFIAGAEWVSDEAGKSTSQRFDMEWKGEQLTLLARHYANTPGHAALKVTIWMHRIDEELPGPIRPACAAQLGYHNPSSQPYFKQLNAGLDEQTAYAILGAV